MKIALDYDGTYTLNPAFWDEVIEMSRHFGVSMVCVTMRAPTEPVTMPCEVIYTSMERKGHFMYALKRMPDVWIDDRPDRVFK